ncbi:MAG: FkbM family methyltransferase [Magnetospirillum sp.]|nr:FkbM family methyltransferase [Magnetospirillum sp.]
MAQNQFPPLSQILGIDLEISVVDVGANPIDGDPPYKPLLSAGKARVLGFEPNPEALARLEGAKGPRETYLPHAVGDGRRHTLRLCQAQGMTSLLAPNFTMLDCFHGFSDWAKVIEEVPLDTVRLDDVAAIDRLDYLKIDIQGGELMVFENATRLLADCLVIQTEVEFVPFYVDQPLFGEVDIFLRGQGFLFHRFWPEAGSRALKPMVIENNIYRGLSQLVSADALFIKDFTRLDRLDDGQLLRMATILHDVYQSLDVVLRLLMEHDRRRGTRYSALYMGQDIPLD